MPTNDGLYGVYDVNLPKRDLSIVGQLAMLNKQESLQALQETSKINAGLSELKAQLNQADYDWFDTKVDEINNIIKKEASFGNYANALNKAIELGGTYLQDSGILARIQANKDYQTLVNSVKARGDSGEISELTRDRWLRDNTYKFDETNQRLASYSTPVSKLNIADIYNKVNTFTLSKITETDVEQYLDKDGNPTDKFVKDYIGFRTKNGYSEIRTREALQNVFDSFMTDPNIEAALVQEYDDAVYYMERLEEQLNNTDDPEKRNKLQKDLDRSKKLLMNGDIILGPSEYLANKSESVLDNLVKNNTHNKVNLNLPTGVSNGGSNPDKVQAYIEMINTSGTQEAGNLHITQEEINNGQTTLNEISDIMYLGPNFTGTTLKTPNEDNKYNNINWDNSFGYENIYSKLNK